MTKSGYGRGAPGELRHSRKSGGFSPGAATSAAKSGSFTKNFGKKRRVQAGYGAGYAAKLVCRSLNAQRGQPPQGENGGDHRFNAAFLPSRHPLNRLAAVKRPVERLKWLFYAISKFRPRLATEEVRPKDRPEAANSAIFRRDWMLRGRNRAVLLRILGKSGAYRRVTG
jgi:hypothetical protein